MRAHGLHSLRSSLRPPGSRPARGDLLLLLVPVVWGLNFIIIKAALGQFSSPQSFNALRWILASGILGVAVAARRDSLRIAPRDWGRIIVVAILGNVLQQVTFINGIQLTTAGHSALMMGLSPLMVALVSAGRGIEEVGARTWTEIGLSLLGLVILVRPAAGQAASEMFVGDLLTLASAGCWAVYSLLTRRLTLVYSPTAITAVAMGVATIVLVAIGLPDLRAQSWASVRWTGWAGLVYSGGLTIAFGYLTWGLAIRRVGSTRTSILSNLTPVVALVAAWGLLGERLDLWQMLGAGMVVGGTALARGGGPAS
ncbi:MAG TPA: DMT family transporter [bacterium]|nr:DMT family transporter [bacterium]